MAEPRRLMRRFTAEARRAASGFVAGFLATLLCHQAMLAVLYLVGLTERVWFVMEPTPPFGLPAVVSLAFWGGIWGVVFVQAARWRRHVNYWLFAALFGATLPTFSNWFIAAPLHGRPLGNGWHGTDMLTSLLVNAAWGLGTAVFLRWPLRQPIETAR